MFGEPPLGRWRSQGMGSVDTSRTCVHGVRTALNLPHVARKWRGTTGRLLSEQRGLHAESHSLSAGTIPETRRNFSRDAAVIQLTRRVAPLGLLTSDTHHLFKS